MLALVDGTRLRSTTGLCSLQTEVIVPDGTASPDTTEVFVARGFWYYVVLIGSDFAKFVETFASRRTGGQSSSRGFTERRSWIRSELDLLPPANPGDTS